MGAPPEGGVCGSATGCGSGGAVAAVVVLTRGAVVFLVRRFAVDAAFLDVAVVPASFPALGRLSGTVSEMVPWALAGSDVGVDPPTVD